MRFALPLLLAQYSSPQGPSSGVMFVELAVLVLFLAGLWRVFQKAGKPGWAAIIPIYNLIVLLEITGKPIWWIVLFFIPLVNLVPLFLVSIEVARRFGKGTGFGIGLAVLGFIFYPLLGFGDAQYQGGVPVATAVPAGR
jgi:hypothetical protein